MRKYIIVFMIIVLIFAVLFISHNRNDVIKKGFSYNSRQEAIENSKNMKFVNFVPIYEKEIMENHYIIVYYDDIEDFLCAASIEKIDNHFYWKKITPYFKFKNATIINNKGSYAIYPVTINDKKLEICLGIINYETITTSDTDVTVIDDKFLIIIKEGKIEVELL